MEALKNQLSELDLQEKCTFCIDGVQVINELKRIVQSALPTAKPN